MQTGQFRVSLKVEYVPQPNPFFAVLINEIYSTLINNTEPNTDTGKYYTFKRLSLYSEQERAATLSRCPDDVKAAATPGSNCLIDAVETDLIDFLLQFKDNRILTIVGSVGVGKTTFLQYVFGNVRDHCPSLHRFAPIMLNCLAIGNLNPTYTDLVYEAARALRFRLDLELLQLELSPYLQNIVENCLEYTPQEHGPSTITPNYTASHFVEFIRQVQLAYGPDREPVVVFDNVDQLWPEAVERIVSLSTSLHLTTKLAVITSMRPTTFLTQAERAHGAGTIYHFRINLAPPDLRSVLVSRMRAALSAKGPVTIVSPNGFRLELSNPEASVDALARRVLTTSAQQFLLRDLCNNNVRKALAAFAYFLRYRELRLELVAPLTQGQLDRLRDPTQERSWFRHLLDGLMIGDREYYVDVENGSPITNLLYFERDGVIDYCLLYRIVCLLEWSARFVEVSELIGWLTEFGYSSNIARAGLEKLLVRGLIFSPESETGLSRAKHLKISSAGQLYLSQLLSEGQYLINAIYDVPLPHSLWSSARHKADFECRLSSIEELATGVYSQESAELLRLISRRDHIAALASVVHCGLLTRRILRAASRLVGDAYYTRRFERAREAAQRYAARFAELEAKLEEGEQLLTKELTDRRLQRIDQSDAEFSSKIGVSSELRMTYPKHIGPADQNHVSVSIKIAEPSQLEIPTSLTMLWQSSDDYNVSELLTLERAPDDAWHRGDFTVTGLDAVRAFPRSHVTIFANSNPVFVKGIGTT